MSRFGFLVSVVVGILVLVGCSSSDNKSTESASFDSSHYQKDIQRLVIKTASVRLEAKEPHIVTEEIKLIIARELGIIDSVSNYNEESVSIKAKVPESKLESVMAELSSKGKLVSKSINAKDVTEEMIDVEARLKNLHALRDKFRALLAKAVDVKDVLAIETELTRIQSDIDSIEGRINSLKNQITYSAIDVHIGKQTTYGPLGYLFGGLYWGMKTLFVIE
ncbi:DUF4349 domain-containing protein [Cellvibrio fibrivorans]|uniref:Polyhydroxyalkanoate synthesis regulator phasin n=1 Tax=Cellvibrio fibrivorans TaxID=126350 RepID=A0ABU1V230_9GAMM|nr:DUF4349 domain-containing protein [Cellvibrio fibrivorans]MDR7091512.1 polyhydroxyalkanoate synthesis regulator phasin [Cellvibrio fibrivorans]